MKPWQHRIFREIKKFFKKGLHFSFLSAIIAFVLCGRYPQGSKSRVEKSPSPVYGARLELVYGLIAHRGFESLLLRQAKNPHKCLRNKHLCGFSCAFLLAERSSNQLKKAKKMCSEVCSKKKHIKRLFNHRPQARRLHQFLFPLPPKFLRFQRGILPEPS